MALKRTTSATTLAFYRSIPGMGAVKVRWIVSGKVDKVTVEVDSRKGGVVSKTE